LRQVLIPGINDGEAQVRALVELAEGAKIELKAYHRMGLAKWAKIGQTSPLAAVPAMSAERADELRAVLEGYSKQHKKH
jgi:pyruvate-formate lyase-activating enzyme